MYTKVKVWYRTFKYCIYGSILLGILIILQIVSAQEQAPITIKEALESNDQRIQNKTIDKILADRLIQVDMLIKIVEQTNEGKSTQEAGNAAAYLLGELRAPEAVPVLSIALAKYKIYLTTDIDRLDYAVFNALVKIGRPSVSAMITNITKSDDEIIRKSSINVLGQVLGGKDNLIRLLNLLIEQKERTEEEKNRLKKTLEWSESITETTKPLY